MAKLNKQEVNAIANKIARELTERIKTAKLKYISEYKPSPEYIRAKTLIDKYLDLSRDENFIIKEKSNTCDELSALFRSLGLGGYFSVSKELLNSIINKEFGIKETISVESLKDDIIIAGIDSTFDAEKFINDKLTEYIPRSLDITEKM